MKKLKGKKYAFFIDIDGTLTYKSALPSDKVLAALRKAQSLGHKVFINTGRARGFVSNELINCMPFDGIICALGQYIEMDGKVLRNICLKEEQVSRIVNWAHKNGRTGYFEGVYDVYSINDKNTPYGNIEDTDFKNMSKIFLWGGLSSEDKKIIGEGIKFYIHETYVETVIKGYSKAAAMFDVLKEIGFPKDSCVAVGDSGNDIEMVCEAAIGIAVGNATEELKKAADYIAKSNEEDGVADAAEYIMRLSEEKQA